MNEHIDNKPYIASRFEDLADCFFQQITRGLHPGAQLCVRQGTKLVAHLWGGVANTTTKEPVRPDTIFMVYSATKALTAIMIHILAEKKLIDIDEPVSKYWPAFAKHDKENVTIRHVLCIKQVFQGRQHCPKLRHGLFLVYRNYA
jgi:CubicO group peptidase (beta-lactamase class C family)